MLILIYFKNNIKLEISFLITKYKLNDSMRVGNNHAYIYVMVL